MNNDCCKGTYFLNLYERIKHVKDYFVRKSVLFVFRTKQNNLLVRSYYHALECSLSVLSISLSGEGLCFLPNTNQ